MASNWKLKIFNEVSRDRSEWRKSLSMKSLAAAKVATRECQELNASTEKQQRLRRVIGKLPVPYKLPEVAVEDSTEFRYQRTLSLSMFLRIDKSSWITL